MQANYCFNIHGEQSSDPLYPIELNSNIEKGSKQIVANNFNSLVVGDWIRLCEYNFPVENDFWGCVGQITKIENISGNIAEIKDEASK